MKLPWLLFVLLLSAFKNSSASFNTTEIAGIAQQACAIVAQYSAQITYIYRCVTCQGASDPFYLELVQTVHACMCRQTTVCTRSFEAHEEEPIRQTDSNNVLLMPSGEQGEALSRRTLSMLNAKQRRKHMHKYIFIWPTATAAQLSSLFEGVWAKGLLFALAITDANSVYGFQPFEPHGLQVRRIEDQLFFYDKLRDLRGYELRYSMFADPLRAQPKANVSVDGFYAVDGQMAHVIAKHLNASARYVMPADNENYGYCRSDGNFTGVLRDIIGGVTHIAFNVRFVLECIEPYVEQLYPYGRRTLYLVVPAAEMRAEYLIFVRAFKSSLWHFLTGNFLIVFVFFFCLQRVAERIPGTAKFRHARWFEIFEMFMKTQMGEPVSGFSKISSLRQFLIAWVMFSYVLTTIYFAKLESSFIQPTYEPQLDTLDELDKLHMPIYAIGTLFDAIRPTLARRHFDILSANAVHLPLNFTAYQYAMPIIRKSKHVGFIMRDESAKDFLANTFDAATERPSFHIVKEYLRSMLSTYILPEGSPFLYKFQAYVSAFHEHGLLEFWQRMDVLRRKRESSKAEEFFEDLGDDIELSPLESADQAKEVKRKRVVLSLGILQGAFYLWIFGIALSVLGFIAEYVHWFWFGGCKRVLSRTRRIHPLCINRQSKKN